MTKSNQIMEALLSLDPGLFEKLESHITDTSLYRYLKPIADTQAPFQTASATRGKTIERLLHEDAFLDKPNISMDQNYQGTGNTVLLLGQDPKRKAVWLLAHLDTITYLVRPGSSDGVELEPICYHLMEPGRQPAAAIGYDLETGEYHIVAKGDIEVTSSHALPVFLPDEPIQIPVGTRVCFDSELSWDRETGLLTGSLDDAGGAAALLSAFTFLAQYDIELLLGLTDEEEGLAASGNQSFARGGARLLRWFYPPELAIASDIHEGAEMYGGAGPTTFAMGDGASFSEKSSGGKGAITPPHLYALQRQLAAELAEVGIDLKENLDGYLSRTEGVNAMLHTPNVALIGFLGGSRHFQRGPEQANINDLVNLAKTIVCYALLTTTEYWPKYR